VRGSVFDVDRRVLVLALARMADALGNSFLIVVLPLYIASGTVRPSGFGLTEALVIGVVLSAFGLLNSATQPFTGRLSDRVGKRTVFVLFGLAVLAVTSFALSLAADYLALILVRALQGIGVAFTIPATVALVSELATTADRGGNMGVFNTFRLLGFGIGPVVAGGVVDAGPYAVAGIDATGFEAAFYVAALAAVASFVLVLVLVDDPEDLEAQAGEDLSIDVLSDEPGTVLDPVFTLAVASLFMVTGIALFATLQPQVNERLSQSSSLFGLQFAAFVFAQVLLQTPLGRLSDRVGRRPVIVWGLVVFVPMTLVQGVVPIPVLDGVIGGSWQMTLARFLQGVAGAAVLAPAFALAGDVARTGQSGSQLSLLTMSFGLGTAVGPISSGVLIRYGFLAPFAFGAALAAVGAALVYTQVEETVPSTEPLWDRTAAGQD